MKKDKKHTPKHSNNRLPNKQVLLNYLGKLAVGAFLLLVIFAMVFLPLLQVL